MSDWIPILASAADTLVGVILGWALNYLYQKKAQRIEHLSIAFSDLFRHYLQFVNDRTDQNRGLLLSCVERVRLFCSKSAVKKVEAFRNLLLPDKVDFKALGGQYKLLHDLSRKEVKR